MFNDNHVYVSEYLLGIKNWMIRKMTANYIVACEQFKTTYSKARPKINFPFSNLDELCDLIYEIKEDHHLIFKRVIGPEKIKEEDKHKIDPSQPEVNFIANVGRLFHKMLVARELKYLHNHYDPLNNSYSDAASELELQLKQIDDLFTDGVQVLVELMQLHSANILLLVLIVENMSKMRKSIGINGAELLRRITGQINPEATYFLAGKYYMEGGWYSRAEKMFKRILRTNPKHTAARLAMDEIKIAFAKQVYT